MSMDIGSNQAITSSYNINQATKKKMDPVKKGGLIGAGVGLAAYAAKVGVKAAKKSAPGKNIFNSASTLLKQASKTHGGKLKLALSVAEGVVLATLLGSFIGEDIGKLVKNHQEKKAAKEEQANQNFDKNV